MNILYLLLDPTQAQGHRRGGYATHVREVISALEDAGHSVEVLDSRAGEGTPHPAGSGVTRRMPSTRHAAAGMPPRLRAMGRDLVYLLHNLRAGRLVRERLARGGVDLVYERFHHLQWAGVAQARRHGVPVILEFNAGVNEAAAFHGAGLVGLARRIEDSTLSAADRVITVSGVLRREVLTRGVVPERVVAMHNGVSTERFHPGIDGSAFRQQHDLRPDDIVVGFVGTFAPWHGVELLIEAALKLVAEQPRLRFLIIGGRPGEPRFNAARHRVHEAGARSRILLVGEIPFAQVPEAMGAMDIATIPWATDYGSPMKIFEYMAMGKALVAPDLEVLREVFRPDVNALLVPPGDVGALAAAIGRLAVDGGLRQALGAQARRDAVEHHDWGHHADLITRLATAILAERAGGRGARGSGNTPVAAAGI